jgi:hypothetical protein
MYEKLNTASKDPSPTAKYVEEGMFSIKIFTRFRLLTLSPVRKDNKIRGNAYKQPSQLGRVTKKTPNRCYPTLTNNYVLKANHIKQKQTE